MGELEVARVCPQGETEFNRIVIGTTMCVLERDGFLLALDATTGKEIRVHAGLLGINY